MQSVQSQSGSESGKLSVEVSWLAAETGAARARCWLASVVKIYGSCAVTHAEFRSAFREIY